MKKSNQNKATITKSLFFILFFLTGIANAQIVNIPDANFKEALLNYSPIIDTNGDGEIQVSEALNVYTLYINNISFTDTTGLESFSNLTTLYISSTTLTSLDLTPLSQLQYFNSYDNLLLVSINFNSLIKDIAINNNNSLISIDLTGLVALTSFLANNNDQLSTINFSGNINLGQIVCKNNQQLSSLDVSGLENLTGLDCSNNQLSSLSFVNCPLLHFINCKNNNLTSLNFTGLNNINNFDCSNNMISEIFFTNVVQFNICFFVNNDLVNIDFSKAKLTGPTYIDANPIQIINLKNGFNEINVPVLTEFPEIVYVCQDENQVDFTESAFLLNGTTVNINSYCSFTPGGNYNTIAGNVKFDADDNGCDTNDPNFPNIRVNINDGTTTGASFTDVNGNYFFYTQAGSFDITPAVENPSWFNFSPTTANVAFANNNNNTSTNDFCLSANGVHPDLEIVITPVIPARPGFEAVYKIVYKNKGNQTLSQQYGINFFYNQNLMQYVTSSVATSQSGVGSLSWDYIALHPFESRAILVTFLINPPTDNVPVNIGDELTFTASIMPQAGDENTIDNLFILNQTVVGSYDPNDITCLEGDVVSPTEIGNYLHYNIRFENTGTAPAENIVAKVVVNSTDFDINSLQLLNTSHPVDARINGNIIEFIFQSINLESGGHGNVLLKVKSKSNLQQGDIVEKKAEIYFDYNFPVETNNAETVFQLLNNPGFEQDNTIKIHPNPAQNTVYINGDFSIKTVELYDAQGRLLQSSMINENETTIDITNKSKGVYFVKVSSDKGIKVEKLVKN